MDIREIDEIRCEAYNDDPLRVSRVMGKMPGAEHLNATSRVLQALAHPLRVAIYAAICIEPLCVCELSILLRMSPPALMYHLRLLARAGLITVKKSGKFAEYHPRSESAKEILHLADSVASSPVGASAV